MKKELILFGLVLVLSVFVTACATGGAGSLSYKELAEEASLVARDNGIPFAEARNLVGMGAGGPGNQGGNQGSRNCSDSDAGIDYFNYGILTVTRVLNNGQVQTLTFQDRCSGNSGRVREYYCDNNLQRLSNYRCPDGCANGACLPAPQPNATCVDLDGGLNYYISSNVTETNQYTGGVPNTYSDMCINNYSSGNLAEAMCELREDGMYYGSQRYYNCSNGCLNGACINQTNTTVPQSIRVISPNGGENIITGTSYNIRWESSNINQVYIKLRRDGATYAEITPVIPNTGSYLWNVPSTLPSGNTYEVRVLGGAGGMVSDDSDAVFSITNNATQPNNQTNTTQPPVTCTDTDNGLNYFVQGTAALSEQHPDACLSGGRIHEYYCTQGTVNRNEVFTISSGGRDVQLKYAGAGLCTSSPTTMEFELLPSGDMIEVPVETGGSFSYGVYGETTFFRVTNCNIQNSPIEVLNKPFISENVTFCDFGCSSGACLNQAIPPNNQTNGTNSS